MHIPDQLDDSRILRGLRWCLTCQRQLSLYAPPPHVEGQVDLRDICVVRGALWLCISG
jgi:hypothetical protein